VQQSSQADDPSLIIVELKLASHPSGGVHYANRVFEARVQAARVNEIGHGKLTNPAQALNHMRIDQPFLFRRVFDQSMNGAPNLHLPVFLFGRFASWRLAWYRQFLGFT